MGSNPLFSKFLFSKVAMNFLRPVSPDCLFQKDCLVSLTFLCWNIFILGSS